MCNCRGNWKGSWIWCALCFITLPCISAKCLGIDLSVRIYPEGSINIEYGNPLEIFCVADGNYSSNDIEFRIGTTILHSEIVNSTTRRLYVENPEKQSGAIYCRNIITQRVCVSRVIIDSRPSDVTDFNCVSDNLEKLNCSWSIPYHAYAKIDYKVSFYLHNNLIRPFCAVARIGSTSYCVWSTSTLPRYRQGEETLFFYLNACNMFGCNSQNFTIDHYSIVKPDRPYDLRVVKYHAHSVVLKWKINHNMVDFLSCGVDHIIQYNIAKTDDTAHFHTVDTSHLPPKNKTYIFHLMDLPYAHTQYEVQVRIKSKKASRQFWSDYAFTMFTTLSEIPKRPPVLKAGAFDQTLRDTDRVISVYWQEIDKLEEAGPDFSYKALVTQGDTARTIYPDKSMNHVSFYATPDALNVTVWSVNINGTSLDSNHIYIPPKEVVEDLTIPSLTKVSYENGTYALSWHGLNSKTKIDNFTLFWCEHSGNQICIGRIDYAILDSAATSCIIDLPTQNRYQFAIAAVSGFNTSGMTWATIFGVNNNEEGYYKTYSNNTTGIIIKLKM